MSGWWNDTINVADHARHAVAADVGAVSGAINDANAGASDLDSWLNSHNPLYFGGSSSSSTPDDTKKPDDKKPDTTDDTKAAAPTESPYEELANAQADQYLAMTKALDPLTSGADIPAVDATMSHNASQMLGQSSTSPVSQWLNQQTSAAQAQYAPTEAATQQVAAAETNAEGLEAGGLKEMGQAETALMTSAPYDQLLNSLASEVPYHLAEGYSIPGLTKANTPSWLQQAEENVGVTPLAANKGSSNSAQGLLPAPATGTLTSPSLTAPESNPATQG